MKNFIDLTIGDTIKPSHFIKSVFIHEINFTDYRGEVYIYTSKENYNGFRNGFMYKINLIVLNSKMVLTEKRIF